MLSNLLIGRLATASSWLIRSEAEDRWSVEKPDLLTMTELGPMDRIELLGC